MPTIPPAEVAVARVPSILPPPRKPTIPPPLPRSTTIPPPGPAALETAAIETVEARRASSLPPRFPQSLEAVDSPLPASLPPPRLSSLPPPRDSFIPPPLSEPIPAGFFGLEAPHGAMAQPPLPVIAPTAFAEPSPLADPPSELETRIAPHFAAVLGEPEAAHPAIPPPAPTEVEHVPPFHALPALPQMPLPQMSLSPMPQAPMPQAQMAVPQQLSLPPAPTGQTFAPFAVPPRDSVMAPVGQTPSRMRSALMALAGALAAAACFAIAPASETPERAAATMPAFIPLIITELLPAPPVVVPIVAEPATSAEEPEKEAPPPEAKPRARAGRPRAAAAPPPAAQSARANGKAAAGAKQKAKAPKGSKTTARKGKKSSRKR